VDENASINPVWPAIGTCAKYTVLSGGITIGAWTVCGDDPATEAVNPGLSQPQDYCLNSLVFIGSEPFEITIMAEVCP